ncbi:MAG: biotin--[acetyl-CoA-carboxylase] ligase [Ilumatobacteraceae bacterium]
MDLPGARWRGSWPRDWEVRRVAATGSTNADLLVAAHAGAPDRLVLVADHQTAGAGRLGRIWDAPPGTNLLVSLLLRSIPAELHQLTQRVGLAALAAVAEISGREARLKWPNDVLLDGRKLAGILAQAASPPGSSSVEAVVVGLGLNVGWAPPEAACLGTGTPRAVLGAVLRAFDALPSDPDQLHQRYLDALDTIGRRVRVELGAGSFEGAATGVERSGTLIVSTESGARHVTTGDVIHLRVTNP